MGQSIKEFTPSTACLINHITPPCWAKSTKMQQSVISGHFHLTSGALHTFLSHEALYKIFQVSTFHYEGKQGIDQHIIGNRFPIYLNKD